MSAHHAQMWNARNVGDACKKISYRGIFLTLFVYKSVRDLSLASL